MAIVHFRRQQTRRVVTDFPFGRHEHPVEPHLGTSITDFVYVVLILAAITDVTPFYTRNKIKSCKSTTPVCGTDGKTYKNICHLQAAQSNDHDLQLFHKQSCEEDTHITPPKKTEQSTTNSNSPRGKNRKYRSIFSTSHLAPGKEYCPTYWVPVCGSDVTAYLTLLCGLMKWSYVVAVSCVSSEPVCGNDGNTYDSICHLSLAKQKNEDLLPLHPGYCRFNDPEQLTDNDLQQSSMLGRSDRGKPRRFPKKRQDVEPNFCPAIWAPVCLPRWMDPFYPFETLSTTRRSVTSRRPTTKGNHPTTPKSESAELDMDTQNNPSQIEYENEDPKTDELEPTESPTNESFKPDEETLTDPDYNEAQSPYTKPSTTRRPKPNTTTRRRKRTKYPPCGRCTTKNKKWPPKFWSPLYWLNKKRICCS
ncbi:unnamed protein product [Chilo suppressalis]|uniref:Kazal-like domain-containing protein n=1 Tax=Chilo suppressalis TaxID=168631 RepID=A0ABN8BCE7_CHISP|nr:unnamed protein product [Chilo suppressalis]